ncbi:MAG: tyrosine-type recombinase/integrase [Candidatus Obscuribacterales bacterium]
MPKLTQKFVNEIPYPERGQVIFRDDKLPGFGLRVTPGSKTYVVEARVHGVARRLTLGKHGLLSVATARKKARKLQAMMAAGKDPIYERQKKKVSGVTLQEVLDQYLAVRNLRPNTIHSYRYMVSRCLGDWLDLPVVSITREMVEQRHIELRKRTRQGTSGEAQANTVMHILGALLNSAAANYEVEGNPIILQNPVKRLSQNRRWYQERRRQTVVPDHKLPAWYQAVTKLSNQSIRDYLLLLLFTGLRRNEAATLRWEDIDFDSKVLRIRAEIAKNRQEHRLPLSGYLNILLQRRYEQRTESPFVFPGRGETGHMIDSGDVIDGVGKNAGFRFMLHDLRRTFLTIAERLALSYVVLKKLANHSGRNDTTFGYVIVDVERLREPMQMITNEILRLCAVTEFKQPEP